MKTYTMKAYLLMALFAAGIMSCSSEENKLEESTVKTSVVLASPMSNSMDRVLLSGKVESAQATTISTRVMGYVEDVLVNVGDKVSKGQLLVRINSADVLAKQAQVSAMISEAKAAYESAQKDASRFEKLHEQKSATDKELENVQLQLASMKSKYEAAQHMKEEVEVMLKYTNIVSPYSGHVTQKMTEVGNIANPGMPLLIIEHAGDLQIAALVSEQYISAIKEGQLATVNIKAVSKSFTAKVSQISFSSTQSGGQYMVKLSIPAADAKGLLSGMYTDVLVQLNNPASLTKEDVIIIPISAIVHKDHLAGVYVVSSNVAYLRWLRLGKTLGDKVEVLSGLSLQDQYVLSYDGKLFNGCEVRTK